MYEQTLGKTYVEFGQLLFNTTCTNYAAKTCLEKKACPLKFPEEDNFTNEDHPQKTPFYSLAIADFDCLNEAPINTIIVRKTTLIYEQNAVSW